MLSISFAGLGIAIGYSVKARAALPVANPIYPPTRMFGGIAWAAVDGRATPLAAAGGLTAHGAVFLAIAAWRCHREERRRYR